MLERISLLPKTVAIWERRVRIKRLAQVASVVALILYFLLLSGLLSYYLLTTSQEQGIKKKISQYQEKVKELEPIESKQFILKAKLKELVGIFKTEEKPEELWSNVDALSIEGVEFSNISYAEGSLTVRGEASNALVLDEFIRKVEDEGSRLFSQAALENINRTIEASYVFSLSLLK